MGPAVAPLSEGLLYRDASPGTGPLVDERAGAAWPHCPLPSCPASSLHGTRGGLVGERTCPPSHRSSIVQNLTSQGSPVGCGWVRWELGTGGARQPGCVVMQLNCWFSCQTSQLARSLAPELNDVPRVDVGTGCWSLAAFLIPNGSFLSSSRRLHWAVGPVEPWRALAPESHARFL